MAQKKRHIFEINHTSVDDDATYRGTFTCKRLSIRGYAQVQVTKTRLNGGMHFVPNEPGIGVDENTDNLNGMLAQLEVALIDTPDWWNLDDISDMELVGMVFSEVVKFENSFRTRDSDTDSEAGSQAPDTRTQPGGDSRQVVGEEVSASLEP